MSRTDKTAPFWVRLRHGTIVAVENHNHAEGPCDLPERIDRNWWVAGRRCNWDFLYTGHGMCSCPMCHAAEYPHRNERQRRRRERRRARERNRRSRNDFAVTGGDWA